MNKIKLDKDEQEILESFERGEWKSVKNVKEEILKHQQYARNTLKKDKRVNIRCIVTAARPGRHMQIPTW